MTDSHPFHSLFKKATFAFTGTLIGRVSAACAGILMARSLQTEMFGIYAALWELVLLCAAFTETGMTVGIQRDGTHDHNKLGELLGNTLVVRLIIGLPCLFVAYFYSFKMTAGHPMLLLYTLLAVASAATVVAEPMYSVLQVLGKQKKVALYESLRGILSLAVMAVLVISKCGVTAMACGQGIIYVVVTLLLVRETLKDVKLQYDFHNTIQEFKSSLVFGMSGLIFSVYASIPILFLSYLKGPVTVGYYAASYRIISMLYIVGSGVYQRAFLPALFGYFKQDLPKYQATANFMQQYLFVFGILSAIAMYVAADAIILILMGEKYYPAINIMRLLCVSVALTYIMLAGDAVMTTAGKNYLKIIYQIFVTLLGGTAGYFLIQKYDATGAALTANIIRFAFVILYGTYVYKKRYITYKAVSRFVIPFAAIIVCGMALVYFVPHAYFLRMAIFCCVGGTLLYAGIGKTTLVKFIHINQKEETQ